MVAALLEKVLRGRTHGRKGEKGNYRIHTSSLSSIQLDKKIKKEEEEEGKKNFDSLCVCGLIHLKWHGLNYSGVHNGVDGHGRMPGYTRPASHPSNLK